MMNAKVPLDASLVRPSIARLGPAQARFPTTAWSVPAPPIRLHLNEAAFPPSPRVVEAIVRYAGAVGPYPDPQPQALLAALSARAEFPAHRIVLGAGCDELIETCALAFLEPGRTAVMPSPAFPKYRQACLVAGGEPVVTALAPEGHVDAEALRNACDARTRIVFVPTPNNPTGGVIPALALRDLVARAPRHAVLVFDEAYHEFARAAGAPDLLSTLADSDARWVVLRSLSKAYCLAGMRVGYALAGDDELAEWLQRVRPVFNVTSLSAVAAVAALGDEAHRDMLLSVTARERERLVRALGTRGLAALPSATNFLAIDLAREARPIIAALKDRGILVAGIAAAGYERFIRVSIGTAEHNDALLAALTSIVGE